MDILKKLLFHPGKRIVKVHPQTKKVVGLIVLGDLFNYFVQDDISNSEPMLKNHKNNNVNV